MQEDINYIVEEDIKLDNERDRDEPDDLSGNRKITFRQQLPEYFHH